jgi:DNA-directed RNA polymerase subunit beta'
MAIPNETLIPKWRNISVFEGEQVEKGETVSDGPPNPHDILRLKSVADLAEYITNEIQEVYRLQGVTINDKHIEVIVRQMLRKVEITDPGESTFIRGEQAEYVAVLEENDALRAAGKQPASLRAGSAGYHQGFAGDRVVRLCGFVPGNHPGAHRGGSHRQARFPRGLKENVVVGRLIPAGTGLAYHSERKRKRAELLAARTYKEQGATADQIEQALSEAFGGAE